MNAKMVHFVLWWTDEHSRQRIRGLSSIVTVGIKANVEMNMQENGHDNIHSIEIRKNDYTNESSVINLRKTYLHACLLQTSL